MSEFSSDQFNLVNATEEQREQFEEMIAYLLSPGDGANQAAIEMFQKLIDLQVPIEFKKLAAYPFQKYGMVEGEIVQVGADATEKEKTLGSVNEGQFSQGLQSTYRTLVKLSQQYLEIEEDQLRLTPGMQVSAEIKLTDQTVMEYLLSPVRKAFHDAGRER